MVTEQTQGNMVEIFLHREDASFCLACPPLCPVMKKTHVSSMAAKSRASCMQPRASRGSRLCWGSDRPRILQPGSEPLRQGLFGEGQGLGVLAHPRHPSSDHSYYFCFYRLGFWLRRFQKGLALLWGEKERRERFRWRLLHRCRSFASVLTRKVIFWAPDHD